jgi:hypothetical protein
MSWCNAGMCCRDVLGIMDGLAQSIRNLGRDVFGRGVWAVGRALDVLWAGKNLGYKCNDAKITKEWGGWAVDG